MIAETTHCPFVSTFRERLRVARKASVGSQYKLAEAANVEASYISKIESGKQGKNPGAEFVQKIATAMGINERWLLDGSGPQWISEHDDDRLPARAAAIRAWRKPYDQAIESVATMHFKGAESLTPQDWAEYLETALRGFRRGHGNDPRNLPGARIATEDDD